MARRSLTFSQLRRDFAAAIQLFTDMSLALEFEEFLTVPASHLEENAWIVRL